MDPTAPDVFRVLCAPGHAPDMWPATIDAAERTGADVIAWSEMYRLANSLPQRAHYAALIGHSRVNTRAVASPCGDAGDNPISVKRTRRILAGRTYRVDSPGRPKKFAPERHLYVVNVEWGSTTVTVINAHPSPLFCGLRKWRRVMRAAVTEVKRAQAAGHAVVLCGDIQTHHVGDDLLHGLGLTSWVEGVVWMAWSGLEQTHGTTLQPKGMDHAWMLSGFRVRP